MGGKFGVQVKSSQLAMGAFDLIIQAEAADDADIAKYVLSLASRGNVRTTTIKVFPEADFDKILAAVA
ncbi:MAG TPA: GYD domain-containing protein [Alphaproteobacteria bacterium]|nr:GYD domain-containing protein [Alphaproteobacteria bacterium]